MTDDRALLEAVKAAPRDDAPRLIFADWLEEHGQEERARFVRWQCANRRCIAGFEWMRFGQYGHSYFRGCPGDPPAGTGKWFLEHGQGVAAGHPRGWVWTWHRGFVCRVEMPADDAFARLGALLADWPVTTVVLTAPLNRDTQDRLATRFFGSRSWQQWASEKPLCRTHLLNLFYPAVRFRERFSRGFDVATVQWEEQGRRALHYAVVGRTV